MGDAPVFPVFPSLPPDSSLWDAFIWAFTGVFVWLGQVLVWTAELVIWSIWSAIVAASAFVVGLFPDPPAWIAEIGGSIAWATGSMSAMCNWINYPAVGVALGIVVSMWVVGLAVRVARIVASYATLGGGMGS